MYFIYNALLYLVTVVSSPLLLFLLYRNPRYRDGFFQKLGVLPWSLLVETAKNRPVWVHAVSVGEVTAAIPLVNEIKRLFPQTPIILSTGTATGFFTAQQYGSLINHVIFFPFDYPLIVRRFIARICARIFIAFETELWPNLLRELKRRDIPVVIASGRISPRAFRRYRAFRFFFKNVLAHVDCFCMQSSADAERVIALGADPRRVFITGNIKFDLPMRNGKDIEQHKLFASLNLKPGNRLFIAGSTHRGEEEIMLDVFQELQKKLPDLVLLVAPRHPARFREVENLIRSRGICFCRKTSITPAETAKPVEVILLDTIGELAQFYAIGTVIFIGGSLVPVGGHNILEPALYKKPILFGPYMDNFSAIAQTLIEHQGAIQASSTKELGIAAARLFNDAKLRERIGLNAFQTIAQNAGAVTKCVDLIKPFIDGHPADRTANDHHPAAC